MTRYAFALVLLLALIVSGAGPAVAQNDVSEASGQVVDRNGDPVAGAEIEFRPRQHPERVYRGKTNKKGRYYIQGLWTPSEDRWWTITVAKEGYAPVRVRVESRSVNRVLVGPVMDEPLRGAKLPDFTIAKMGSAKVDLTLAPEAEVQAERQRAAVPVEGVVDVGGEGGERAAEQPAQKDPWLEATALANAGDFEGSVALFKEAIEDQPEDVQRYETFAKVLAHLGRYEEAQEQVAQFLALAPSDLNGLLLQSQVAIKAGDFDQARAALEAAREQSPNDMRIYDNLAYIAKQSGDVDEQIRVYSSMTDVDPDNAEAWLALGDLYARTGRLKESEQAYQKVVAIDPQNAYRTYYNLAVLIINRDKPSDADMQRAIDALRKSVEIKPDYAQAYKELGFALIGTGAKTEAANALESYLEAQPKASDADQMRAIIASLQQ